MMVISASGNLPIYLASNETFRSVVFEGLQCMCGSLCTIFCNNKNPEANSNRSTSNITNNEEEIPLEIMT